MKIKFSKKRDEGLTGLILFNLYRINKNGVRKLTRKLFWNIMGKHHEFYSKTLRKIFSKYHNVEVGMYSGGACFIPGRFPSGTKVGRYCSIARTMIVHDANHPTNLISSSAFFFNPALGYIKEHIIPYTNLEIGHDVWIGDNAIILASCKSIGHGAVIGAGAVVNKDIPPYAIVLGNPARVVRFRFSSEKIDELLQERWWDKSIEELAPYIERFHVPLEAEVVR